MSEDQYERAVREAFEALRQFERSNNGAWHSPEQAREHERLTHALRDARQARNAARGMR